MLFRRSLVILAAAIVSFSVIGSSRAEIRLPAIFGDHMVLQEAATLPIWGTAAPGETVTIKVGTETGETTAAPDGTWRVDLPPQAAGAPVSMTVTGKNRLTFDDVLVGQVWICGGQSNMEFNLGGGMYGFGGAHNAANVILSADDPQLRLFVVRPEISLVPLSDVSGKWEVCTPDTAARFSAVGYFFGRALRQSRKCPVGLIGAYWGGTPAEAWTSLSGLQKDLELAHYVADYQRTKEAFAHAPADYPAKMLAYKTQLAAWQESTGKNYATDLEKWNQTVLAARGAGEPPPPKPKPAFPMPRGPASLEGDRRTPANLYNAMLAPLIPFAIKGAIWYQGESNAGLAAEYRVVFRRLIIDWREHWGQGDFPFLFVQLAGYNAGEVQKWPYLRESQLAALSLPKTGMASAIDIGVPDNVHPPDKEDVGNRLALAARKIAYGENVVCSGPIYDSMQVRDQSISVKFTQEGSGLKIAQAPWIPPGAQPLPADKLVGFDIAGADQEFVPADARIEGSSVVVSSAKVLNPVAVRYAWANAPVGNLYNVEGLPASPFRTDDWFDPAMGQVLGPGK